MKKIYFSFLTVGFLFFSFPFFSFADIESPFKGGGIDEGRDILRDEVKGTGIIESDDAIAVAMGWVNFALTILGVVAFIAFVWAGALYVTSFTNEENNEKAKKVMIYTTIGLIVMLISYPIVTTIIRATVESPTGPGVPTPVP